VALEAAVKSGAGELRDGGLQGVETVVEREQGVFAKGHRDRLLFGRQRGGTTLLWSHRSVLDKGTLPPLLDRLGVEVVALSEL
jgi:hypothetical protein